MYVVLRALFLLLTCAISEVFRSWTWLDVVIMVCHYLVYTDTV